MSLSSISIKDYSGNEQKVATQEITEGATAKHLERMIIGQNIISIPTTPQLNNGYLGTTGELFSTFVDVTSFNKIIYMPRFWDTSSTSENIGTGDGSETNFSATLTNLPVIPGSIDVTMTYTSTLYHCYDNGQGTITGSEVISGNIDYITGDLDIDFADPPDNGTSVDCAYDYFHLNTQVVFEPSLYDDSDKFITRLSSQTLSPLSLTGVTIEDEIMELISGGTESNKDDWRMMGKAAVISNECGASKVGFFATTSTHYGSTKHQWSLLVAGV